MLNRKAQASYELLLLVAFVFAVSLVIGSYFFEQSDASRIEAQAKSVALRELNKEGSFYFIKTIAYYGGSSPSLELCLSPEGIPAESENRIKAAVSAETKLQSTTITIVSVPVKELCP